ARIEPSTKKIHEENQLNDSHNKKIDDRLIRKGASHKNLTTVYPIPRHHGPKSMAGDELAIIDYKEVVQIRS
ncbi:hypothetical protein, partial [Bifidobacterium sp.]|uniref:hypothetical protein n=1 Tax=Bifidobacterium sp. TaxID=41200 RepID=UPI003D7C482D